MKRTALLLVCVMFLTTFQNVSFVKAETNDVPMDFSLTSSMLREDSKGLSVGERDDTASESALVRWDGSTAGKYDLTYYVEAQEGANTVTKQVNLSFNNIDKSKVDLGIQVTTSGNLVVDTVTYVERIFNNSNFSWSYSGESKNATTITKALYMGSKQNREVQEFNIELTSIKMKLDGNKQDNLKLRVKIVGDYVYVYTNGIAKGNITPFSLKFDNELVTQDEMFNGPKNYQITPTHLYQTSEGNLASLDYIEDTTKVKPGSVPGIKVSFSQVKRILDGKFSYIHNITDKVELEKSKITLQLGTRYTLSNMTNAVRLDFIPTDGAGVKVDLKDIAEYKDNVVKIENGNTVALYLSKTDLTDTNGSVITTNPKIIKWSVLEPSTIVDGSFQYSNRSDKYWPSNKGYTYLNYSLNKTNSNQVQLNIQPYNIKSRATYSVYILTDKDSERKTPSVVYEYDPAKTNTTSITTIVPAGSPSYFQIIVSIDNNTFKSQLIYYDPAMYPSVPEVTQIKTIDNVYVVPSEITQGQNSSPQAIGFDIEWLAPQNVGDLLKGGKLYYELLLRKDKNDYDPLTNVNNNTDDIYATYSKIFEVSLNNETGKIEVKPVAGTAGKDYSATPELRYSKINNTFSMENVSLMNFGAKNGKWEKIKITEDHLSKSAGKYLDTVTGKAEDSLENRSVPGTYYFSFRTVFVDADKDKPIVYSEESNMVAVSLDNTNEVIPVPYSITGEDTTNVDKKVISEKISIKNVDIMNYVKKMLEPANLKLYESKDETTGNYVGRYRGNYEIYIYQETDKLSSTISDVEAGKINPIKLTANENKFDLNQVNLTKVSGTDKYIDTLRKGEVIPILLSVNDLRGIGSESFELLGLDPNEVYYMKVRVKLSPWRNNLSQMNSKDIPARYSLLSKEFTFTTTTTPLPPSSEDKVPPTPEKIWIVDQPNNTTATLGWAPAKFEVDENTTKTYYEFIRTDLQLTKAEQSGTVESLVSANENRIGFRSDSPKGSNPFMSTYTKETGKWMNLTPEQVASKFQLTDDTLEPNTVYYYYVRTVCVTNGDVVKSTWIMIPVTTAPVLPPINLKVELPKDYPYEATEETVISFDAPVPSDSLVPDKYKFDIAIRGELDEEYTSTKYSVTKITSKQDSSLTPKGYTHFVYKITGLKPNKRYFIKVRVVDKTKPTTADSVYPTSLYCDPVTTRTEFDELENEKDNKYEEYLKKYDSEAEKLRRRPYWVVEDGATYKYRESYIYTELGLQTEYQLVGGENTKGLYYYLPASLFTSDNNMNTILKVTIGDYSANIRPQTLTEDTPQIKNAIELVNDRELTDYYVGVSFAMKNTSSTINNEASVTPQLIIDMELVYIKDKENSVEEKIMSALNTLITSKRLSIISKLEKEIYNGTIADDILNTIIDEAISDVERDHIDKVDRLMDATIRRTVSITTLQKPILLIAKMERYAVTGYYLESNWIQVETYSTGNGFAIEASKIGNYIFTGQQSLITTVPSLAPYENFITKYNLTDFFNINADSIKRATTKEQVYSAVARVIGAPRGIDYIVHLKNTGVKGISSIGISSPIRQDEAIYIIMQGYEKLNKRSINTIVIKNKLSVQNIGAFQTPYRQYVYAAVELKIVDNPGSKVLPTKQMTVEEIIKMLYKIQN